MKKLFAALLLVTAVSVPALVLPAHGHAAVSRCLPGTYAHNGKCLNA